MSGGTVVPRHQCPGGHFFQGDSHASDTGSKDMAVPNQVSYMTLSQVIHVSAQVHFPGKEW